LILSFFYYKTFSFEFIGWFWLNRRNPVFGVFVDTVDTFAVDAVLALLMEVDACPTSFAVWKVAALIIKHFEITVVDG
jgi:hypothetical protein